MMMMILYVFIEINDDDDGTSVYKSMMIIVRLFNDVTVRLYGNK